jgi:hypothetical protein
MFIDPFVAIDKEVRFVMLFNQVLAICRKGEQWGGSRSALQKSATLIKVGPTETMGPKRKLLDLAGPVCPVCTPQAW